MIMRKYYKSVVLLVNYEMYDFIFIKIIMYNFLLQFLLDNIYLIYVYKIIL